MVDGLGLVTGETCRPFPQAFLQRVGQVGVTSDTPTPEMHLLDGMRRNRGLDMA